MRRRAKEKEMQENEARWKSIEQIYSTIRNVNKAKDVQIVDAVERCGNKDVVIVELDKLNINKIRCY